MLQALSASQEKWNNIPPYERAVLEGEVMGRTVAPGVVVLIAVGVSAWRHRRRAENVRNKLSERSP